ncbi:MAG: hypothetical protein RQ745_12045 [Longimicrobiales bacterium]|nr:hypothetical protein [Longimicrobiales bacterium]
MAAEVPAQMLERGCEALGALASIDPVVGEHHLGEVVEVDLLDVTPDGATGAHILDPLREERLGVLLLC